MHRIVLIIDVLSFPILRNCRCPRYFFEGGGATKLVNLVVIIQMVPTLGHSSKEALAFYFLQRIVNNKMVWEHGIILVILTQLHSLQDQFTATEQTLELKFLFSSQLTLENALLLNQWWDPSILSFINYVLLLAISLPLVWQNFQKPVFKI